MSDQTILPANTRSFSQLLAQLEDGEFNAAISETMRDLVGDMEDHAADHGKGKAKGSLSVSLKLNLQNGVVFMTGEVKSTPPKNPRGFTTLYVTPDNNLSRQNENQREMAFKDVTAESTKIKTL